MGLEFCLTCICALFLPILPLEYISKGYICMGYICTGNICMYANYGHRAWAQNAWFGT